MEYYFYILVVVALFLKLGLYFCWYHMRRRAALAREVHIVMPDGTTRRAVVTGRPTRRSRREDRQILAQSDTLQHSVSENQGFEERPVYPRVLTANSTVGGFSEPPPYSGVIGGGLGASEEWKLPKYEDLPPPYTNSSPAETGCSASEVATVPNPSGPPPASQPQMARSTAASNTASPPHPSIISSSSSSSLPPPPGYSVQSAGRQVAAISSVAATAATPATDRQQQQEQHQMVSIDIPTGCLSVPSETAATENGQS